MSWIDVHTHLNMLEISPEEALSRARSAGVEHVITIGTCPADWPTVLESSRRYSPRVFCTLGVHPHEAELYDVEAERMLRTNLEFERLVAIGEIGLDFYYDNAPRERQRRVFEQQMEIAAES